jgi:hypothetical protein
MKKGFSYGINGNVLEGGFADPCLTKLGEDVCSVFVGRF